ncbi:hypothetical protein CAEBREN_23007 [Caenorhabditis brenneri]|uniref:Uncharacterized protein n=1 Tax=Caenorhabditis brenneri TaxID=135651 RepID=G0N7H6_CAEBE|nr:hypothetical protein CAEBREN_23007 [Caenorhabditis brenneri]
MARALDRFQLAEEAVAFMLSRNVKAIVPDFSEVRVEKTTRLRVHLVFWTEDLVQDHPDGTGTDPQTLGKLGQLASRCAWQLQEKDRLGEGKLVENHFSYTHHRAPLPKEAIHIVGKANATSMGTHQLSFSIHTYINRRRVPIGSGHSSLAIVPSDPQSAPPHHPADDTSESSSEGSDDEYSDSPLDSFESTPPSSPQPPSQRSGAEEATTPVTVDSTSSLVAPPSNPPLVLESVSRSIVSMDSSPSVVAPPLLSAVPRRSILRQCLSDEERSRKRRRSVSWGRVHDENMKFMLINVVAARPQDSRTLQEKLTAIGVAPKDIKFVGLPIKRLHSHVFYFSVSTDMEKSKMENEIEKRKWGKLFDVNTLCSETSPPFFWRAYSIESILKACLLAAGEPSFGDDFAEQLDNKELLREMAKKQYLMRKVVAALNAKGARMLDQHIKSSAAV